MEMSQRNSASSLKLLTCDRIIRPDPVKEELKCRICLGILRIPQECKTCENCYCSDCLDEWLKNTYMCPMKCSEEPKFRNKPHKIIRNMLSELVFQCKNELNGCEEEVPYDKILDHELSCNYELMLCSGQGDGCDVQLIKKEMINHEKQCQLVPVICEYCQKKVKRSGIKAHWMYCEEAELPCEYCNAALKKKNYLIHVNALCEEYIMNCGRCAGTYKRKYKEFHDCIRHLQNCQKTMSEDIKSLKEKLIEKDKKICELENRLFFDMADIKHQLKKLKENQDSGIAQGTSHSRISSIHESSNNEQQQTLQLMQSSQTSPKWNNTDFKMFQISDDQKSSSFMLNVVAESFQGNDQVFGYIYTELPMTQGSNYLELEIQQLMTTNFIPMYYIIGAIGSHEIEELKKMENFDEIYYKLSPTCCFLPSFGKSFCDKMKFCLRKIRQPPQSLANSDTSIQQQNEIKLEIEEIEKNQKQKVVILENEVFVFFGVYCSQTTHLLNHKQIKVKIY